MFVIVIDFRTDYMHVNSNDFGAFVLEAVVVHIDRFFSLNADAIKSSIYGLAGRSASMLAFTNFSMDFIGAFIFMDLLLIYVVSFP